MDDTNPVKENPEFVENIKRDLETLGVKYDTMSYTSDSFPLIMNYCVDLIKRGLAYCDKTPQQKM